jgi:DNA-binding transcriptional ArsR family regulator
MQNNVLTTSVDVLMDFIKKHQTTTVSQLVSYLKLPQSLIDRWLVILEEYGVVKVNYKGFEGIVELVKDKEEVDSSLNLEELKGEFIQECKSQGYDYKDIALFWKKFVEINLDEFKKEFYESAKKKKYPESKIALAWKKYQQDLMRF